MGKSIRLPIIKDRPRNNKKSTLYWQKVRRNNKQFIHKINDAKWKEFEEIYQNDFDGSDEEFLSIPTTLLEETILMKKSKEIVNDYDYSDYTFRIDDVKYTRK